MSAVRWSLQAALGVFAIVGPASAQEGNATKVWLNPGFYSHHFKQGDYREDNYLDPESEERQRARAAAQDAGVVAPFGVKTTKRLAITMVAARK